MAQPNNDIIAKIRQYATRARDTQQDEMEIDSASIEARLNDTLAELQARVQEQQAILDKLRVSSRSDIPSVPSGDPQERLRQLHIITDAYKRITQSTPFLPSKDSALPALLATREIQQTISGTKSAITGTQSRLTQASSQLRREEANLHDSKLLTTSMENRIERLHTQQTARTQQTPSQLAQAMIQEKQAEQEKYEEQMNFLAKELDDFRLDVLGPMLAAEELGGPVVGDMPEVEDDILVAGFTKKGKVKSTKKPVPDSRRQQRIDQIWGRRDTVNDEPLDERDSASEELKELLEDLVATLDHHGSGTYYQLSRDSAASRFLVRAKVAQFHPKDAKRLRLIDFGRELDD